MSLYIHNIKTMEETAVLVLGVEAKESLCLPVTVIISRAGHAAWEDSLITVEAVVTVARGIYVALRQYQIYCRKGVR